MPYRGEIAGLRCHAWLLMAGLFFSWSTASLCQAQHPPASPQIAQWLGPQKWHRDVDGPIIALGEPGAFDDTHIFAPAVVRERGKYWLWYCGSRDTVALRVFRLGLATGSDGQAFDRHPESPVYEFGDGRHSVLTATFLRSADGDVLRENGKLRMWFSATDFQDPSGLHTLHETASEDGINWSPPSPALLENVYAPTILRDGDVYRMWYTDVGEEPWIIRHAESRDGRAWRVSNGPALVVDQNWERDRLFYPTVLRADGAYLMWYGSYWNDRPSTTALGFAVSENGLDWVKHLQNPVLRPDTDRPWESHYVTSQSVLRLPDRSFRIWYASRKAPPFINKYFALNTARWVPPRTHQ